MNKWCLSFLSFSRCCSPLWRVPLAVVATCIGLLSGCATYHPEPIDPEKIARSFENRSLGDPGLREYVRRFQESGSQGSWPPERLDLLSLTWIAYYFHPDLDVARAKVTVGEAGIITAGGRPNPSLRFLSLHDSLVEGATPWTLGLLLDIPIETAGKRGYRIKAAEQLAAGARVNLANAAWAVRSRVRARLVDASLLSEEMRLSDDEVKVRSEIVRTLDNRLQVGEVSRPEVELRRVELQQAEAARLLLLRDYEGARVALAEAAGVPVTALEGHILEEPALMGYSAAAPDLSGIQREGLQNRLDLRQALLGYEATEWALRLEIAKQYPDVQIGPGYALNQGFDRWILGGSLTLPILNQNEGPIAEALARRKETAARFEQLQAVAIAQIGQAAVRLREARAALSRVEDELFPLQQSREESVRSAFAIGQADRLDLLLARLETLTVLKGRFLAELAVQNAVGALEDAIQQPLDGPKGRPPRVEDNPRAPQDPVGGEAVP